MSALNMIVRGQQAHLLTDRAVYDGEGVVQGLGIKVARAEWLPLAVAGVGALGTERLANAMDALCPNSPRPEDWVAALPAVLLQLRAENARAQPEWEARGDNEITVAAIYYSRELGRARGVVVTTADPSLPAYTPVPLVCITVPAIVPATGVPDARQPTFDPRRDGAALVDAQRRAGWSDGCTYIGGGVDLTTVGPEGLTLETLHTWPDEIGRRIDLGASARLAA